MLNIKFLISGSYKISFLLAINFISLTFAQASEWPLFPTVETQTFGEDYSLFDSYRKPTINQLPDDFFSILQIEGQGPVVSPDTSDTSSVNSKRQRENSSYQGEQPLKKRPKRSHRDPESTTETLTPSSTYIDLCDTSSEHSTSPVDGDIVNDFFDVLRLNNNGTVKNKMSRMTYALMILETLKNSEEQYLRIDTIIESIYTTSETDVSTHMWKHYIRRLSGGKFIGQKHIRGPYCILDKGVKITESPYCESIISKIQNPCPRKSTDTSTRSSVLVPAITLRPTNKSVRHITLPRPTPPTLPSYQMAWDCAQQILKKCSSTGYAFSIEILQLNLSQNNLLDVDITTLPEYVLMHIRPVLVGHYLARYLKEKKEETSASSISPQPTSLLPTYQGAWQKAQEILFYTVYSPTNFEYSVDMSKEQHRKSSNVMNSLQNHLQKNNLLYVDVTTLPEDVAVRISLILIVHYWDKYQAENCRVMPTVTQQYLPIQSSTLPNFAPQWRDSTRYS